MNARKKIVSSFQKKSPFSSMGARSGQIDRPQVDALSLVRTAWQWLRTRFAAKVTGRRLQVTASVPLGEKRFVAVVKVDGREFLVGGGATNVALLASLDGQEDRPAEFAELLDRSVALAAAKPAAKVRQRTTRVAAEPIAAAKKKVVKPAVKSKVSGDTRGSVRMPQWSAQLNVAPALGHFIKPSLKSAKPVAKAQGGARRKSA